MWKTSLALVQLELTGLGKRPGRSVCPQNQKLRIAPGGTTRISFWENELPRRPDPQNAQFLRFGHPSTRPGRQQRNSRDRHEFYNVFHVNKIQPFVDATYAAGAFSLPPAGLEDRSCNHKQNNGLLVSKIP